MKYKTVLPLMLLVGFATQPLAQEAPAGGMKHKAGMQHGSAQNEPLPTETGQSAFAAIQEIVAKLEADPATDWSKVNIEALRQHLIDMNAVTLGTSVEVATFAEGRTFKVSGEGAVVASIQRMLMAHAATMNGRDGWSFATETTETGARLQVKPPSGFDVKKLDALGFIGILTMGMHHQEHHWMIARGGQPH